MENLTTKQRGDAAEHYVISMLGFNSIPAAKMPDNWPGYDLVAQPLDGAQPLRISVRFRIDGKYGPYVRYRPHEPFDFIALVYKRPDADGVRTWILPRSVADKTANGKKTGTRFWSRRTLEKRCAAYENNFRLAVSKTDTRATA